MTQRDTKKEEEEMMRTNNDKLMPRMKPATYEQRRRTALERSVGKLQGRVGESGGLNRFYSRETLPLILVQLLITSIVELQWLKHQWLVYRADSN